MSAALRLLACPVVRRLVRALVGCAVGVVCLDVDHAHACTQLQALCASVPLSPARQRPNQPTFSLFTHVRYVPLLAMVGQATRLSRCLYQPGARPTLLWVCLPTSRSYGHPTRGKRVRRTLQLICGLCVAGCVFRVVCSGCVLVMLRVVLRVVCGCHLTPSPTHQRSHLQMIPFASPSPLPLSPIIPSTALRIEGRPLVSRALISWSTARRPHWPPAVWCEGGHCVLGRG